MTFRRTRSGNNVHSFISFSALSTLILFAGGKASAQSGEKDYRSYCATCHGIDGKGKGEFDGIQVPDLTRLSQKNGGKFPFEEVYEVVDGHNRFPWHQQRAGMPYWGEIFTEEEAPPAAKAKVQARISAIVEYIRGLQRK
jgi:mono/diheme cytochrome c family protein